MKICLPFPVLFEEPLGNLMPKSINQYKIYATRMLPCGQHFHIYDISLEFLASFLVFRPLTLAIRILDYNISLKTISLCKLTVQIYILVLLDKILSNKLNMLLSLNVYVDILVLQSISTTDIK
jgi:hypothetical protein